MFNKGLRKFLVFILVSFLVLGGSFSFAPSFNTAKTFAVTESVFLSAQTKNPKTIFDWFVDLISPIFGIEKEEMPEILIENSETLVVEQKYVYISGRPVGFSLSSCGAVVVETSVVNTISGEVNPLREANIMSGDILIEIEGEKVCGGADIVKIVNSLAEKKESLSVKVQRSEEVLESVVFPALDKLTGTYRLGLWVRDNAVGVGTMTYVDENNNFFALGHPVVDIDTGVVIPVNNGQLYKCTIVGVNKGKRGVAGDLKGLFLQSKNSVGTINKNTERGIEGLLPEESVYEYRGEKCRIAGGDEVVVGKAKILTTIDGGTPRFYDIEIAKTNYVNQQGRSCMIIKVVDEELIEKTGGIVQGMSGSPVIQNGNLVGCVTHVFVNDPTRGFADFVG